MPWPSVNSKGQITIPADLRKDLGLHPGPRVAFVRIRTGTYEIRPETASVRELKGRIPRPQKPVTLEEMDQAIVETAG
jgi:antitoxin PrlF